MEGRDIDESATRTWFRWGFESLLGRCITADDDFL